MAGDTALKKDNIINVTDLNNSNNIQNDNNWICINMNNDIQTYEAR